MPAMACPPPRVHVAVVTLFIALLFLGCQDGPASGDVALAYAAEVVKAAAAADGCSEEVVKVYQNTAGHLANGIPYYKVTITNTCLACTVSDVHVSCGEFASTELVRPSDFRRLAYGDCLVRDGGPIAPGEIVSFQYSNSFPYSLNVAAVSCGGI
ncbi:hypothetical protein BS78_02G347200 [Paspalum vaginatum]|nr:hypothetical protein BS78_02G347200 [Paspalum vaginatum]